MPIPTEYLCPITSEPMEYPSTTPCNHTFEAVAIIGWINSRSNATCPCCRAELTVDALTPNATLKAEIEEYLRNNPDHAEDTNAQHIAIAVSRQNQIRTDRETQIQNRERAHAQEQERLRRERQERLEIERAAAEQQRIEDEARQREARRIRAENEARIRAEQAVATEAQRIINEAENQRLTLELERRIANSEIYNPQLARQKMLGIYSAHAFTEVIRADNKLRRDAKKIADARDKLREILDSRDSIKLVDDEVKVTTRRPFKFYGRNSTLTKSYTVDAYEIFRREEIAQQESVARRQEQATANAAQVSSSNLHAARDWFSSFERNSQEFNRAYQNAMQQYNAISGSFGVVIVSRQTHSANGLLFAAAAQLQPRANQATQNSTFAALEARMNQSMQDGTFARLEARMNQSMQDGTFARLEARMNQSMQDGTFARLEARMKR